MSDAIHIITVADELARICDTELKATLDLKSVIVGDIAFLPAPTITNMVNGILIKPSPAMTNEPSEIPKVMMQSYFFRLVYVRRMEEGENPIRETMADGAVIANKLFDKTHMPDVTNLPATAQILWCMVKSIEWEPPEDDYVSRVSAEFTAIAINLEVVVRTRRA